MSSPAEQPAAERFPNGPFTRYMIGEGISMTGTWMQAMAQGWVMAGLTASGLALAAVNFESGLPMLLLFRLGGMYADRYDKRYILQACQLVQICLAVALGTLIARGSLEMWHIIAAATLLGISNSFEMPAARRTSPAPSRSTARSSTGPASSVRPWPATS